MKGLLNQRTPCGTFATTSLSFLLFVLTSGLAQQATLASHQKLNLSGLHFWYPDYNKPVALFNRNITPKGDCITIVNDFIFFTWYQGGMNNRNLMLSRKKIGSNHWVTIQFPDKNTLYKRTYKRVDFSKSPGGNSYRSTAVGVSTIDGTVHLVYDTHSDQIKYRVSKKNIAFAPDEDFKLSNFEDKKNYLRPGHEIRKFTYPNFNRNDQGALILDYRVGGSKSGNVMVTYYNGTTWSPSQKITDGRGSNPTFNFYGKLKYQYGNLYLGGSIREQNNTITSNQKLYLAIGGQGNDPWQTADGTHKALPFRSMSPFGITDTSTFDYKKTPVSSSFVVSKSGAVHFTKKTTKEQNLHFYKPVGSNQFRIGNSSIEVAFAANKRVYGIKQIKGAFILRSTPENESNWRTDLTYKSRVKFDLFCYEYYQGKLHIIANEKKESDIRPLHHLVINVGSRTSTSKNPVVPAYSNTLSLQKARSKKQILVSDAATKTILYPIPVQDELFIERPNSIPGLVQVFSMDGKKVRSIATDQRKLKINTNDYESGTYILKIRSEGNLESLPFTIK